MKFGAIFLLFFYSSVYGGCNEFKRYSLDETINNFKGSIFKVLVTQGDNFKPVGTATIVDYERGLALTASHIFEGLTDFDNDRNIYLGEILLINPEMDIKLSAKEIHHRTSPSKADISILSIEKEETIYNPPKIKLSLFPNNTSTPLFMMGYTLENETLSYDSLKTFQSIENPNYYTNAKGVSDHGHSGSIIFDVNGNAIGLLKGGNKNKEINLYFTRFIDAKSILKLKDKNKNISLNELFDKYPLVKKFGETNNTKKILDNLSKRHFEDYENSAVFNLDLNQAELFWLFFHFIENPSEYVGVNEHFLATFLNMLFCENLHQLQSKLLKEYGSYAIDNIRKNKLKATTYRLLAQESYNFALNLESKQEENDEEILEFLTLSEMMFAEFYSKHVSVDLVNKKPLGKNFHHEYSVALKKKFSYTKDIKDFKNSINQALLGLKKESNEVKLLVQTADALSLAEQNKAASKAYGFAYDLSGDENYKKSWKYSLTKAKQANDINMQDYNNLINNDPEPYSDQNLEMWLIESKIDDTNIIIPKAKILDNERW